ncbi:hypothetical protein [Conexibacter woesei]|uniref:hypothetical protein n=1 Tax=Conexibacter woesei TaxID=191495 RepID=UPI000407B54A|nr:hypothetical protein [Conexibacter woesei]
MIARVRVAIAPAGALVEHDRLWSALSAAFPADFVAWDPQGARPDGVIGIGDDGGAAVIAQVPALAFPGPHEPLRGGPRTDVLLTATPLLDARLHDVALEDQDLAAPLVVGAGEVVLGATAAGEACWTRHPHEHAPIDRIAAPLFALAPDAPLRTPLHGPRSLVLIALVAFLRAVAEPAGVQGPPVRATILFDDPNLRRPTYGHIDFAALVRHADAHNYHAAMAMIPLDRHGAHGPTVRLFRQRADRVSLAFHGNNHEKRELLQPRALPEALALCAQALRRVQAFEAAEQLPVSRVMTAPHGMVSPATASALGALPYDGLCAIHPFPWREEPIAGRPLAGWDPATFTEGCAVLPRVPLDWGPNGLALRAYLDQAIVLYGHHDDVASGLEPLAVAAQRVNRIGAVQWTSLGAIAQSSHRVHALAGLAVVRPFANRVVVTPPAGAQALTVMRPAEGGDVFTGWSLGSGTTVPFGDALPLVDDAPVTLRLHSRFETPVGAVTDPPLRPWPAVRRIGTELRDRLAPLRG